AQIEAEEERGGEASSEQELTASTAPERSRGHEKETEPRSHAQLLARPVSCQTPPTRRRDRGRRSIHDPGSGRAAARPGLGDVQHRARARGWRRGAGIPAPLADTLIPVRAGQAGRPLPMTSSMIACSRWLCSPDLDCTRTTRWIAPAAGTWMVTRGSTF